MTKKIYSVPAMHCSSCVMLLEGLEDELKGVERVDAQLKKLEVTVEFDESIVEESQILEAARREGYELISKED